MCGCVQPRWAQPDWCLGCVWHFVRIFRLKPWKGSSAGVCSVQSAPTSATQSLTSWWEGGNHQNTMMMMMMMSKACLRKHAAGVQQPISGPENALTVLLCVCLLPVAVVLQAMVAPWILLFSALRLMVRSAGRPPHARACAGRVSGASAVRVHETACNGPVSGVCEIICLEFDPTVTCSWRQCGAHTCWGVCL